MTRPLTVWGLVRRRAASNWRLLTASLLGVVSAATIISAAPVYLSALTQLSVNLEIDALGRAGARAYVFTNNLILTERRFGEAERLVEAAIGRHLPPAYEDRERLLSAHTLWLDTAASPPPTGNVPAGAIVRHLTDADDYFAIKSGSRAAANPLDGADGPIVEAVVSENVLDLFGYDVGDELTVGVGPNVPGRVRLRIVGLVERSSLDGTLVSIAYGMLNPPPLIDPEAGPPPMPLFVSEKALVDVFGVELPGIVMDAIWFVQLDPEVVKTWSGDETLGRLDDFEREVNTELTGTDVSTPLRRAIIGAGARAFFARTPMTLLLSLLAVSVAFYLAMMVGYLIGGRDADQALARTRGFGWAPLARLYAMEGVALAVAAAVVAPLLAIAMVAIAGYAPQFAELTDGGRLPYLLGVAPFAAAAATGLLCLLIVGAPFASFQRGVLAQRLRSARPPRESFFHRYYIDVLLLGLGGLIFWELGERGQIVSGGLFSDVKVNEALLLAPPLFLIAVGLAFMRVFPMLAAYIAGESSALLNAVAAATLAALIPSLAVVGLRGDHGSAWVWAVVVLAAWGASYWATRRAPATWLAVTGVAVQAALLAAYTRVWAFDTQSLLSWGFVALVAVVVGQALYPLLSAVVRRAPAWVSLAINRTTRRPMQYAWLAALLALAAGVGVLSTTVGGTLERSRVDRVRHQVAGDVRVNLSRQFIGGVEEFRKHPNVALAGEALRTDGQVGALTFEALGIDSFQFDRISWYRDDFSASPLDEVVAQLRPQAGSSLAVLPEDATEFRLWCRPAEEYEGLSLNVLVQDRGGLLSTLFMGEVGAPEWKLLRVEAPDWLSKPLTLVAVHLQEPGQGGQTAKRSGSILVDYLHAVDGEGRVTVVEDFESSTLTWLPIVVDPIRPDALAHFTRAAREGNASAQFTFGQITDHGVRGFYRAPTRQYLPIVFSEGLMRDSGAQLRTPTYIKLAGRHVAVIVQNVVRSFPTMGIRTDRFAIMDGRLLMGHVNVLSSVSQQLPNEVYIRAATDDDAATLQVAEAFGSQLFTQVTDRVTLLAASEASPAMAAGWRALAVFSPLAAALVAVAGYASFLLLSEGPRRVEAALLLSFGFSRAQLAAAMALEHLSVLALSLGLGTWVGFRMSSLLVEPLAVSEAGGEITPSLLLLTDWPMLLFVYAALGALLLFVLIAAIRRTLRVNLATATRLEP